ncbi:MAG: XylR N-terminal domain-containing protein [Peptococcaceae bacterium]|jgi:hypothetical protein|nr:XylR N-terminal domain-containing protein [Peptococcaceae bacterium]
MNPEQFKLPDVLRFEPEEGRIHLLSSRKLLLQADAVGELRRELINSLGTEISRGVLTRFGYQCGYNDAELLKTIFPGKGEWILAGPLLHSWQGVVKAQNEDLQFDSQGNLVVMRGSWSHSYEAEQHIRTYGPSGEAACWTLVGYATGYATSVLGCQVLCVETSCVAQGNPCCTYEIRPACDWGEETNRQLDYYRLNPLNKNLGTFLLEESRGRSRRRNLAEALPVIGYERDADGLLQKLAASAHRLTEADGVFVVVPGGQGSIAKAAGYGTGWEKILACRGDWLDTVLTCGEMVRAREFAGFPLVIHDTLPGSLVVVEKPGHAIGPDEEECLRILTVGATVALRNLRLQERLRQQGAVFAEVRKECERLEERGRSLQNMLSAQNELARAVLVKPGLPSLVGTLIRQTGAAVAVLDTEGRVLAGCGELGEIDAVVRVYKWCRRPGENGPEDLTCESADPVLEDVAPGVMIFPLDAGGRRLGHLVLVERERPLAVEERLLAVQSVPLIARELSIDLELELTNRVGFLERLLTGRFERSDVMVSYAGRLGIDPKERFAVIVVQVAGSEGDAAPSPVKILQIWEMILASRDNNGLAVSIDGTVSVLIRLAKTNNQDLYIRELVESFLAVVKNIFPRSFRRIAVSRVGDDLSRVPPFYREAQAAVRLMSRLGLPDNTVYCDRLGVLALLLEVKEDKLAEFTHQTMGRLLTYEHGAGGPLLATLKAFVRQNYNIQKTAKSEFLGLSTLKYRVRRIQEVTGLNLKDPGHRLQVALALHIMEHFDHRPQPGPAGSP